jgi:hypothetical protein
MMLMGVDMVFISTESISLQERYLVIGLTYGMVLGVS